MARSKLNRNKNRSDIYQQIFCELNFSNEMLADFAEAKGLTASVISEHNEELLDLKDELKKEFWRLVEENLTERQQEVLKLSAQGYTQTEIAKKLGVNQSSITKSINGNTDYKSKKGKNKDGKKVIEKKSYGGCKRKLERLAEEDPKLQAIFKRIAEINAEMSGY